MEIQEKWAEVYTKEQLKRLQQLELQELKVVKRVCDQLNIKFILYGGTLLGAFKYKGFIPWDDDVDIAMDRDSYEKFITEAPKLLPSDYVLQNLYTDPKSPYSYTKLRLKGTRCIEYGNHLLNIEQGIYMDIYPIDDIPDDDKLYRDHFAKLQKLFDVIYTRQCLHHAEKGRFYLLKEIKRIAYYCFYRLIPISYYRNKQQKEMTKYNGRGNSRKTCWHYPKLSNYYEQYYPLKEIQYEGETYYAPFDTESHLRRRYGNIDELPPVEKRLGHQVFILDFGVFKDKDPQ